MLVTLSDQCDQKLMEYREQEKIELKTLKDEKRALQEMIFSLQNDKQTLKVQLDKVNSIFFCVEWNKLINCLLNR